MKYFSFFISHFKREKQKKLFFCDVRRSKKKKSSVVFCHFDVQPLGCDFVVTCAVVEVVSIEVKAFQDVILKEKYTWLFFKCRFEHYLLQYVS